MIKKNGPVYWWNQRSLLLIVLFGLFIRILFYLIGASLYYGTGKEFLHPDTPSYALSFINWWHLGQYTFDLNNPDAFFGRAPGYPVFWGIHYILFGEQNAYQAVAITQLLLDTFAIVLIYEISLQIFKQPIIALIGAFLYSIYPFVIVWNTQNVTEILSTFLTILFFYFLVKFHDSKLKFFLLGIIIGCATLVRPYLGILLISGLIWLLAHYRITFNMIRYGFILATGFLLMYSGWPIRNYVKSGHIIYFNSLNAGYPKYAADYNSFQTWIQSWDDDVAKYTYIVFKGGSINEFPPYIFADTAEKEFAAKLMDQMRSGSFTTPYWEHDQLMIYPEYYYRPDCTDSVTAGFNRLHQSFMKCHPLLFVFKVPAQNFYKAFFKMELVQGDNTLLTKMLFLYRTFLQLLAILGTILLIRNKKLWPLLFFVVFIYFYICCYFRRLEMRYLLQAEVLMLIPAAYAIYFLIKKLARRFEISRSFSSLILKQISHEI